MATAMLAMLPPALVVLLMQSGSSRASWIRRNERWPTSRALSATSRKSYGELEVIHGVDVRRRRRRVHRDRRARRAAASRRCCGWSPGSRRSPPARSSIGDRVVNELEPKDRDIAMVFQNYALYPHMSVFDNMAYGLRIRGFTKDADQDARGSRRGDPRARPAARAQAAPALGRPAPARRDGPRDRARAGGVPVRRAAVEPRRQAARADALRDPAAAPAPAHDEPLRDARPGRGDDARGPHDRDERGPRRADRRADGGVRESRHAVRRGIHRLAGDEFPAGQGRRRQSARVRGRSRGACIERRREPRHAPSRSGIRPEHLHPRDP